MDEIIDRRPTPFVTYILMVVMVFIQAYLTFLPSERALYFFEIYSLFPVRLLDGVFLDNIYTYIFLHGNWVHLFVNIIALMGAGIPVEREIGHLKFFFLFILAGVSAGMIYSIMNPLSSVPLVGSSGAIFGIIAVLFLLMPFKLTYVLVVPLPSVVVGLMLVMIESSAVLLTNDLTIAHDAHLVGFIVGFLYSFLIDKKRAIKGFFIALIVMLLMYFVILYYGLT